VNTERRQNRQTYAERGPSKKYKDRVSNDRVLETPMLLYTDCPEVLVRRMFDVCTIYVCHALHIHTVYVRFMLFLCGMQTSCSSNVLSTHGFVRRVHSVCSMYVRLLFFYRLVSTPQERRCAESEQNEKNNGRIKTA
jgi:hypothetical protein